MLSRAQLAAMPRTTPTAEAEAVYAARRGAPARADGPLVAPSLRAAYRPTLDGKLLRRIGDAAVDAYELRKLPPAEVRQIGAAISADLLERYPAVEMAILEKWACTRARTSVFVQLSRTQTYRAQLPMPVLTPTAAAIDYAVEPSEHAFPVPLSTAEFFARAEEVAQARAAVKYRLLDWPVQFKGNAKRQPHWAEIAAAWPLIGEWFAAQPARAQFHKKGTSGC